MVQNFIADRNNTFDQQPRLGLSVAEEEGKLIDVMQSRIRQGVGTIELQFGSQGGIMTGPDSIGMETRKAMKDLADLNQVEVTAVHGSSAIQGFSGYNPNSGKFDENYRKHVLDHFKSVLEFASDVTPGSGVVMHGGEFKRPMIADKRLQEHFELYPGEAHTTHITFADRSTGDMLAVGRDSPVPIAVEQETEEGYKALKIETKTWNDFNSELQNLKRQKGEEAGRREFIQNHFGEMENYLPNETRQEMYREDLDLPGYAEIVEYFKGKTAEAKSQVDRWSSQYEEAKFKYENARESLEQLEKSSISEEQKAQTRQKAQREMQIYANEMKYTHDLREQSTQQVEQTYDKMLNVAPLKDVALQRTSDTLAKAAIYAYDITKAKKLDKPMHIVPENISPEDWGSHPDEMIEMVNKARDAFVEKMTEENIPDPTGGQQVKRDDKGRVLEIQKRMIKNPDYHPGISKAEAKKLAEQHVKATLDLQHLGRYKKYFQEKPEWSYEKREREWNKWYKAQVKKLADSGILGHVHLVDGFGTQLTHLPPGEGKMPLREKMDEVGMDVIDYLKIKSKGGEAISWTSEGWGEGPERHLTKSQQFFGTKFFPEDIVGGKNWFSNFHGSYAGHAQAPSYFFGDMTKEMTQEDYAPWSEPDVWCNQW